MHVAAFGSQYEAVRALVAGGADINSLENDRYDAVTIAAVKDDVRMVALAVELGGDPKSITSRYDGTALIAAAHLGHDGVVKALIAAGAHLTWAPTDNLTNVDLSTLGVLLMVVGLAGGLISLMFWSSWGGFGAWRRETVVHDGPDRVVER